MEGDAYDSAMKLGRYKTILKSAPFQPQGKTIITKSVFQAARKLGEKK